MAHGVTVEGWDEALLTVRQLEYGETVTVPKSAEPALPATLDVRLSNFPWSIHDGAFRVYREDTPGEHVQIREYPDRYEVSLDRYNPHYRPFGHARSDVPPVSLFSLPGYFAIEGVGLAGRVGARALDYQLSLLHLGVDSLTRIRETAGRLSPAGE